MAENDLGAITGISSLVIQKFSHEGFLYTTEDVGGLQNALKVSSEIDETLTYASEKLVNLETLLLHVLGGVHDVGSIGLENDIVSSELIEKCFTIDLLHSMLNFELRELDSLLCDIQELIVDALQKISSYEQPTELLNLVSKFHDSEEFLKQLQERILEMKIQLTKLQMTSFSFKQNEWKQDLITSVNELPLAGTEWKPQIQKVEQRRIIRMLEKSLERELELEKSLAELKQNEQDHKVKIRLVEQVSACMEEAAEVAWARFLETDNRAEVLMGISKEMLGKFQIFQFNESGTANREEEIKCKLQDCLVKLREKDTSIQNLKSNVTQLINDNAELKSLKEKAQILEKKLNVTESQLKEAHVEVEKRQQQVKEMEIERESLRESIYAVESRARTVEEKNTHLNESNMELTEELEFLKGSNDSNSKKVSVLEKQLRDLDIQLQNARASSDASQEQQNMLYSAIWDMETLIDELKQKVATSESKAENVEERCVMLSETNSELNKELNILRSTLKFTENSLDQVALERKSSANDISVRAGIIMDTVVQLAKERERIQKQLIYLTKENALLREKTKMEKTSECTFVEKKIGDEKVLHAAGLNLDKTENGEDSLVIANEIASESCQVELLNNASVDRKEKSSASHSTNLVPQLEVESRVETDRNWRKYMLMTILVLLFSVLAAHLFNHAPV